jgi:hypothetical protein
MNMNGWWNTIIKAALAAVAAVAVASATIMGSKTFSTGAEATRGGINTLLLPQNCSATFGVQFSNRPETVHGTAWLSRGQMKYAIQWPYTLGDPSQDGETWTVMERHVWDSSTLEVSVIDWDAAASDPAVREEEAAEKYVLMRHCQDAETVVSEALSLLGQVRDNSAYRLPDDASRCASVDNPSVPGLHIVFTVGDAEYRVCASPDRTTPYFVTDDSSFYLGVRSFDSSDSALSQMPSKGCSETSVATDTVTRSRFFNFTMKNPSVIIDDSGSAKHRRRRLSAELAVGVEGGRLETVGKGCLFLHGLGMKGKRTIGESEKADYIYGAGEKLVSGPANYWGKDILRGKLKKWDCGRTVEKSECCWCCPSWWCGDCKQVSVWRHKECSVYESARGSLCEGGSFPVYDTVKYGWTDPTLTEEYCRWANEAAGRGEAIFAHSMGNLILTRGVQMGLCRPDVKWYSIQGPYGGNSGADMVDSIPEGITNWFGEFGGMRTLTTSKCMAPNHEREVSKRYKGENLLQTADSHHLGQHCGTKVQGTGNSIVYTLVNSVNTVSGFFGLTKPLLSEPTDGIVEYDRCVANSNNNDNPDGIVNYEGAAHDMDASYVNDHESRWLRSLENHADGTTATSADSTSSKWVHHMVRTHEDNLRDNAEFWKSKTTSSGQAVFL